MSSTETDSVNDGELVSFVERIEKLEEGKQEYSDDIKDVYSEAKSRGYQTKIIRKIVRERKKSRAEIEEEETLIDLYRNAIAAASK